MAIVTTYPNRLLEKSNSPRDLLLFFAEISQIPLVIQAAQPDQLDERAEQVLRQLKAGRAGGGGGPTVRGAGI